jgi:probable nitrogen fixation protein
MTMSETATATPVIEGFAKSLVQQIRAQDTHGSWERKSDWDLIEPFIVDKEKRKALPMMADPDPDTLWRLDLFYGTLCLEIERETKVMVSPMKKMSHEGFGRIVLIAGRLVVVNKSLRDVHRFGFDSIEKMNAEATKFIESAKDMIAKYPEVANY